MLKSNKNKYDFKISVVMAVYNTEEFLREALERIAPTGMEYHHDEIWHDGNGYAHVRAALVGSSVNIALVDGLLNLGTWQQIVLLDFDNKPRSRNITVQIIH